MRGFEPSDGDAVLSGILAAEDFALALTGYFPEPGDLQSLFYALPEGAAPEQKRVLTVTADGEPVGVVDAVLDWPQIGVVTSSLLLVHPRRQRVGIGSAALGRARETGYRAVRASCPRGWAPGERLLTRAGFERSPADTVPMNRVVHPHEGEHPSDLWRREL